jgi:phosphoribosyl 1,2-cyclic phosphate phosphodiesterase
MTVSFKILGSGAGPGTPSFFCDCPGCREARDNPACARTRSGAFIAAGRRSILVDTPPDVRAQLIREKITSIDDIFLTHWHYDHFGGLGELEYYVKLVRKERLTLYLPPSAVAQFAAAFPNLREVFDVIPWEFGCGCRFGGLAVTPLAANHGVETAGLLVETPKARLAYFPDTSGLPAETARRVEGVDWLICDATFYGDNWYPDTHMSVDEAIGLGRQVKAGNTVLTHLSVHYSRPVTSSELAAYAARHPGVTVAADGMTFGLSG